MAQTNTAQNTELNMPTFPFEVSIDEILSDPEGYVDAVFSCLESEFLVMPKGPGFVEYPTFERGYEALKAATKGFAKFETDGVLAAALKEPIIVVVLRTMLGFSPPEWGYVATRDTGVSSGPRIRAYSGPQDQNGPGTSDYRQ